MMTVGSKRFKRGLICAVGLSAFVTGMLIVPGVASAHGGYGYGGYSNYGGSRNYGYNGPIYHPPSLHYDRVYHATPHWTPSRGWHTHGHYHTVPHYTPGHYDMHHGNHIHLNPRYHHHRH